MCNPEFVRGNQRSYIRISCDENTLDGYEYRMCKSNMLKDLLGFHHRSQNGEGFLYYEVSGMQSLDVYLQTQKLRREFAIIFAKAISFLCKELEEYALNIENIIFRPKYIMVSENGKKIQFIYSFCGNNVVSLELEELLECCVENLDYKDDTIAGVFYRIYENLLNQQEQFSLEKEMEALLGELSDRDEEKMLEEVEFVQIKNPFGEEASENQKIEIIESRVLQKEQKQLRLGLLIMLAIDVGVLFVWKPLNLLKIFLCSALGIVLFILNVYLYKQSKKNKKNVKRNEDEKKFIKEYEEINQKIGSNEDRTQIIIKKNTERFLYNVKGEEPQYIYFSDVKKVIGKDPERVQICVLNNGVSRLHAMIVREEDQYIVEDLNSTNGTWINGKRLSSREPYILQEGDRVYFAEAEYIFR